MKNIPLVFAIVLLLAGILLMIGDFPFEAGLPEMTAPAAIVLGLVLSVGSRLLMGRRR